MLIQQLSEIGALLLMAVALGLDGFSVSLSIGMQNIRLKRVAIIGLTIGCFHIILPFIGFVVGQYLTSKVEYVTSVAGGFILIIIGSYMVFSALQTKNEFLINPEGIKLLSVAIIVSVDSLPVGLSLGLSGVKTIFIIFCFGIITMILSWIGLLIGKKAHSLLGTYSEILGGVILFMFGLNIIFAS
ncbi:manganese efflux pump [Pseudogracilibacillus sp. SE30717A]|uniref:manganese efflux pump MntP n=1 Tax=Pseudogracilibacillus sp. SE30717A TaxID=3098293 RepID=UPI00300DDE35